VPSFKGHQSKGRIRLRIFDTYAHGGPLFFKATAAFLCQSGVERAYRRQISLVRHGGIILIFIWFTPRDKAGGLKKPIGAVQIQNGPNSVFGTKRGAGEGMKTHKRIGFYGQGWPVFYKFMLASFPVRKPLSTARLATSRRWTRF